MYDNIRVVFANRVPDGKEKLRNETQLPHPKYSPYKPRKEWSRSNPEALADRTNQHQNLNHGRQGPAQHISDEVGSLPLFITKGNQSPLSTSAASLYSVSEHKIALARSELFHDHDLDPPPVPQVPFHFRDVPKAQDDDSERAILPTSGFEASTSTRMSPVPWNSLKHGSSPRNFSPTPLESGDGLLSRRLRGLDEHPSARSAKHD